LSGLPDPKSRSLARGTRRYVRKVASVRQWQRIIAEKGGPCRLCADPASNGHVHGSIHFHHLLARSQGGDDVAANIVPLCAECHQAVTLRMPAALALLHESLTDAEYAYVVAKLGEGGPARLFGVGR
jgi:5-methylcytosine-specific restriction endonuclease McrA